MTAIAERLTPVSALLRYLRGLDPRLPRSVWTMEVGGFANAFGNGLAFPFLFIYLHNVRGFPLPTVGLIAGTSAALGIASIPFSGIIVDRIGGKRTLIGSLVLLAVGFGAYTVVHEPWQAFTASAIVGIGNGAFWPSQSALIIGLTPPARRHASFALQRVMRNFGVGLGGVAGGLIATTENATSYSVLFGLDAATFLVFVLVLGFVPDPGLSREETERPGRYREVFRNRVFLGVVGLNVVYVAAGYAQLEVFPVFAKNEASVTERQIGLIFFVNTLAIVLAQLPIAKFLEGKRRMPALALMTFIWAGAWLIVFVGGLSFDRAAAAIVFGLAAIVFGLGECLHGPTQGALVADLAPPRLRGRYMALSTLSWEIGFVIGPTSAGFILAAEPLALWPIAATVCIAAGCGALLLERRIPPELRLTPA
jgi:MFS family permease